MNNLPTLAIIGGGASGLSLAAMIDTTKYAVTIYEKNKALGRKFLVAGKGGFNLTHSEPLEDLKRRYSPAHWLDDTLDEFDNLDFRRWLEEIGIPTYVGSSRRVFPEQGIKPIEVLQAIKNHLIERGVQFRFGAEWSGWTSTGLLQFEDQEVEADITVFALGGGSWSVTGSDGSWIEMFRDRGVEVVPFAPANCRYLVDWEGQFRDQYEGKPLKNIAIMCGAQTIRGEAMVTRHGIEGNCIYALTEPISKLLKKGIATIYLDLKPMLSEQEIIVRLRSSDIKMSDRLSKVVNLDKTQLKLIKAYTTKDQFGDIGVLASMIKALPLQILGAADLDDAISTMGGVALSNLDRWYLLHDHPQTYCIGEMLDWNAPTGGYLLQACFSMGVRLARHFNNA